MTQEIEVRVTLLEKMFQDSIRHTERGFTKVNNLMIDLHHKMEDFKEEMQASREASAKEMQSFRETSAREMKEFKEEMRASREASAKEMKDFKKEMRASREASAKEMKDFKKEMRASREASAKEMKDFKKEMAKKWGDLANRLGTLAEDVVAPNIIPLARKYFNCSDQPIDFIRRRVKTHSTDPGRVREFDAYAVFSDTVVLTETKSTPRSEYITSFAQAITEFLDFFPSCTGKKLIPIFASLSVPEDIVKYATRKKIYVMVLKGDTMDIINYTEINQ